ncbi:MAG: eukaryotic-like serine/threonine-protein kinase [Kribbellaceae bacterium]|jgi:serine/threonine protein kinase|nr:eukaryotic-like serine/threonine-protein kinase [Kribbellaceae bacterium]
MTVEAYLAGGPTQESDGRLVAGRYRIRSLLGHGGMGLVWLAEDEVLRRPVALKQLVPHPPVSEELLVTARARALSEARATARVDHVGAVRIYDLVEDDGLPWIVMELLSGRTLKDVVAAEGPLPASEVARIGLRLLDSLQAAHRAGVVHRDVKPGNVYLCDAGRVVLADFGIASTAGDDATVADGEFAGSPAYVSPERVRSDEAGPASDLFSLGATLFAAVEGRVAFDKGSLFDTLTAVLHDPPAPFLRAGPLGPVIEGLLAKVPERRLSAEAARTALRAARDAFSSL